MSEPPVDVALDNDVILKAVGYGIDAELWAGRRPGVLGAARFVLDAAVGRGRMAGDEAEVRDALRRFFEDVDVLEPNDEEVALAAELQLTAQERTLALDTGEAQLAAIVVNRSQDALETGDKRAIAAFEGLLSIGAPIGHLAGRVWCLEQLILRLLVDQATLEAVRAGICAEPNLDRALSICFACASGRGLDVAGVSAALRSYIADLRNAAPSILAS